MRRLRGLRLSPAMAVAFAALFVAGAASATAADDLARIAQTVTGKQIEDGSITTRDVKNRSLLAKDFKRGQLPRGARGAQGAQGPAGPAGRAGRDGFGVLSYHSASAVVADQGEDTGGILSAECPAGRYPTGGDAIVFDENGGLRPELLVAQFFDTGDDDRPNSWSAIVADNETGLEIGVIVDVICANATPAPNPIAASRAKRLGASQDALR